MSLDSNDAGFILFDKNVSRIEIAEFMHQLKAWLYAMDWIDLHMRDAGGETVVAYRVNFKTFSPKTHEQFHHQILGELKSRFGADADKTPKGVKRWSMSNVLESAT